MIFDGLKERGVVPWLRNLGNLSTRQKKGGVESWVRLIAEGEVVKNAKILIE